MTQIGKRTAVIPMRSDKGMWAINPTVPGDAAEVPDGYAISLHNYLNRPLRQIRRPPFIYDSLMSVANLLRWEDMVNQLTKTLAIDASQNLRTKDSTGLGYTATVVTGTPTGRLTDFTNFLGKVYQMFDNGSGIPAGASAYDGSTVSASPFNTAIASRTVTAFIERLFLAYPRVTFTNQLAVQFAYMNNSSGFITFNGFIRFELITSGTTTVTRMTPRSLTGARATALQPSGIGVSLTPSAVPAADTKAIILAYFRNTSSLETVPLQVVLIPGTRWQAAQNYTANQMIRTVAMNGLRYRATTTGVSGGVEPTWPTAVGTTVVDNTVTWICDGSEVVAATDVDLPPDSGWQPCYVPVSVPYAQAQVTAWAIDLRFGNTLTPTLTSLVPVDIAQTDGVADGVLSKTNYGLQVTLGDFYYPFYNQESSQTATANLDAIIWSEIREPKRILAKNTFTLPEVAGFPTAACQVAGRYLVFKRRGFWVFKRTTDVNIPILPEKPANTEIGCIGPRAWDTYGEKGDTLFWIGENGIYRMGDDWQPEEIGGDAMREEIMARGSGWVESQATYNVPFLVVEHANKEVWVHTQAGKIYVYHIPTSAWSYIDVSGAPPIRSMLYDFVGGRMLVSFGGFGVTRCMETSTAKDTIDNTATPLTVTADVVYKPLELYAPRYEAYLEEIGVFHLATASQTGQTVTPSYSYDRGATFTTPTGYPATISLSTPRVRLPIGATGPSVTVKVSAAGGGGQANWSISKADAKLQVKRGELPYVNATTA